MTVESSPPDLARLTGVRSGKRSYYREYVRSDQRMQRTVQALDSISRALVRTSEGPRTVLDEIARAAGEHLFGQWSLLGLRDGRLRRARPRFVAVDANGVSRDEADLPHIVRLELGAIRAGLSRSASTDDRWARVSMTIEGDSVGSLVVMHGLEAEPEPGDLSLLRILANQAAVSLHTAEQYQAGLELHRRAQHLYDEAAAHARDLVQRTSQLRQTERRLVAADQRELIDSERHRIARELHDSVTQLVLSAGMAVDLARLESVDLGPSAAHITDRLDQAKLLSQDAVQQLSDAIYSLHQTERGEDPASLPDLLEQMVEAYKPRLKATLRVEGGALPMDARLSHELGRIAGEALFNVAAHAEADRVDVRLVHGRNEISLVVADDGCGDPATLRRLLRIENESTYEVAHRGLANMKTRADRIGAALTLRRSRLGGIQVRVAVPLDAAHQYQVKERSV